MRLRHAPPHRLGHPGVAGAAAVRQAEAVHDRQLRRARPHAAVGFGLGADVEVEHILALAAEQRQHAMRGQLRRGFGEVEIVGELGAGLGLALLHLRRHAAALPHRLAQRPHEVGVLAEALDQDRAGALQRRLGVGDALVALGVGDALVALGEAGRQRLRGGVGAGQQRVGEGDQAGLAGDLGLGAALRAMGEVDVLQPGAAVRGEDRGLERRVQPALVADRLQHGGAAVLEVAQRAEPLLQRPELGVVERAGRLLAVARHEGDGGAHVEQRHRGGHLRVPDAEFRRDAGQDGVGHGCSLGRLGTGQSRSAWALSTRERMRRIRPQHAELAGEEPQLVEGAPHRVVVGVALDVGEELRRGELALDHVGLELGHVDAVGGEAAEPLVERRRQVLHPEHEGRHHRPRSPAPRGRARATAPRSASRCGPRPPHPRLGCRARRSRRRGAATARRGWDLPRPPPPWPNRRCRPPPEPSAPAAGSACGTGPARGCGSEPCAAPRSARPARPSAGNAPAGRTRPRC